MNQNNINSEILIPDGLILFISGVPGVGKTTISYELLSRIKKFRIIEETDIIREVLRGYNDYLETKFGNQAQFIFDKIHISDHTKLLTFDEAMTQCKTMKCSFNEIIARQQRKGIATIINGVHVIPAVLNDIAENAKIIFINLYVTNEQELFERILNRDSSSYMLKHIPFIFQTNIDLYRSTERFSLIQKNVFNINVTGLDIDETINRILINIKSVVC